MNSGQAQHCICHPNSTRLQHAFCAMWATEVADADAAQPAHNALHYTDNRVGIKPFGSTFPPPGYISSNDLDQVTTVHDPLEKMIRCLNLAPRNRSMRCPPVPHGASDTDKGLPNAPDGTRAYLGCTLTRMGAMPLCPQSPGHRSSISSYPLISLVRQMT